MKTVFHPFRRRASFLALLAWGLMPRATCHAAPSAPQELGEGLTYARLQQLPDDAAILAAVWKAPALIIDLRHPAGATGPVIPGDLPSRPRAAPLLVLVGPDTPTDLLAAFRERAPALITIGLAASGLTPDLALPLSPEADRRAYDSLTAGVSIESLISENVTRHRFDEAALARDRDAGAEEDETTVGAEEDIARRAVGPPPLPGGGHPSTTAPERPLKDLVLQRAVQLHRALLALGKLPRS
jgi:hypothetical protein